MSHSHFVRSVIPALAGLLIVGLWPAQADAQRRGPRRGRSVASVVFVGGVTHPRFVYYDAWGPRGYYRPLGYFPYGRYDDTASLRLQVTPRETEVYVDGYFAGVVDEFDGFFQRLRVAPGGHDITFYLDGHLTAQENIHLNPGASRSIRFTMETLAPGEVAEPPPAPATVIEAAPPDARPGQIDPPYPPEPRPARAARQAFGTLSIRVQPADAQILIDGESWTGPGAQSALSVELPAGEHRLEVSKDGYARYTETVLILRGRTLTLNVSLVRDE